MSQSRGKTLRAPTLPCLTEGDFGTAGWHGLSRLRLSVLSEILDVTFVLLAKPANLGPAVGNLMTSVVDNITEVV